ncbi:MAG: DUF362 domain-containing protein [Candidatus Accumulibacter sp.]|jgi:hypothetical protein|nr:DUF362 domain-containing protein [Accumulibacter sp.]
MPTELLVRKYRREFEDRALADPVGTVEAALRGGHLDRDHGGARIAVTVGSRGIHRLGETVAAVIRFLKERNALPFIVPAMGSHGGATAEGQARLLESLGVTEALAGAPVRSSMETVRLGAVEAAGQDWEVFTDRLAFEADGILLLNRVKPHTDFSSRHESGLVKMLVIGLGKEDGARVAHSRGTLGLVSALPVMAGLLLQKLNVLGGISLIEDANHHLAHVEVLRPGRIVDEEPRLLELARSWMANLPAAKIDLLVIELMGKEISGTGIDTNVVGRRAIAGEADPAVPGIGLIGVCDLTPASGGNALGVGIADMTTEQLISKIDSATTARNVITTTFLDRGKVPVALPCARALVSAGEKLLRSRIGQEQGVLFIRSTLHLGSFYASRRLEPVLTGKPSITAAGGYREVPYTPEGHLAFEW